MRPEVGRFTRGAPCARPETSRYPPYLKLAPAYAAALTRFRFGHHHERKEPADVFRRGGDELLVCLHNRRRVFYCIEDGPGHHGAHRVQPEDEVRHDAEITTAESQACDASGEIMPLAAAKPKGWVAWSTSPHTHPPATCAVRPVGSTRTPRIRSSAHRSRTPSRRQRLRSVQSRPASCRSSRWTIYGRRHSCCRPLESAHRADKASSRYNSAGGA